LALFIKVLWIILLLLIGKETGWKGFLNSLRKGWKRNPVVRLSLWWGKKGGGLVRSF